MYLVVLLCVLVTTGFLGCEGQALKIDAGRHAINPPVEYVEVTEGDTLTLECSVSNSYQTDGVYWAKGISQQYLLTKDLQILASGSRVSSVSKLMKYHYNTYSIQISTITTEDSGRYICLVDWKFHDDKAGYVHVSVRNFPKYQPLCVTDRAASSTSGSVSYIVCDTINGYPGVDLTWTVDGAGDDDIPNGLVDDYLDGEGRQHVRNWLWLTSTDWGNRRTREFVCTVTSSEFPGLSHTCSANLTLGRDVTTKAFVATVPPTATGSPDFDGTVPPTATGSPDFDGTVPPTATSPDSGFKNVGNEDSTSESLPETKGSDVTQIPPGSSVVVNGNTLAIALVIPALFTVLATVLICVLKRQRQRKNRPGLRTNRTTSPNDQTKASAGKVVDPFSLAQLQNDTYADISNSSNNTDLNGKDVSPRAGQFDTTCLPYSVTPLQKQTIDSDAGIPSLSCKPTEDVENHTLFPFEIELDLNGDCVVYSHIPDESAKRDLKGRSSDHETVKAEHPDERQEDTGYELLKIDCQGSSTSVPKLRTNLPRKIVGQAQQNGWPADELEGADDHFIQDESEEGSVVNPIYEPFEKGYKSQYPVPTTQDESGKWSSPENALVKSDNPAEHQVDNIHYEVLNGVRMDSMTSALGIQTNSSQSRAPHHDEYEGVDDYLIGDESDEGSVDNPIYEPSGNGKTN